MAIATAIIVGLLIGIVGIWVIEILGLILLGASKKLSNPTRFTTGRGIASWVLGPFGLLLIAAGPFAAAWLGIVTGLAIAGA